MENNALSKVGTAISNKAGRTGLIIKKNSPELLLGAGIVGFIYTVVSASKATLVAQDILKDHEKIMTDISDAVEIAKAESEKYEYDESLQSHDKVVAYCKTAWELVKAYAPSIIIGGLSLTAILVSRNIMKKRYLGVVAAYNAVSGLFSTYRSRVINEQGETMDRHYMYGTEIAEVTREITDENGKKKKIKEKVEVLDPKKMSYDLSVVFDEGNPNWDSNPDFNKSFLKAQEAMANNILHSRGHLFMNEVYDMLGFPQTQAGTVTGWVDGIGDGYVDFGLYDLSSKDTIDFLNGKSNLVLLNFNHDGVIWDKI